MAATLAQASHQVTSSEFLSFLVDTLHEDLNRIVKKPYIENPDSDDKTVHDLQAIIALGETYRANHKARNDSICMDLFCGFYKKPMECPVCDKVSVTFDPYSLFTVQLPVENTSKHTVTSVPLSGAPINYAIDIDKNTTITRLKEQIARKHPIVFENHKSLAEDNFQTNDHIFVYELEAVPKNLPDLSKASTSTYYTSFKEQVRQWLRHHYDPLYVTLTRSEAQDYEIILKKVLVAVAQQTSRLILMEMSDDPAPAPVVEKEESAGEDSAQVSDRSVPSEDDYVDVSIGKQNGEDKDATLLWRRASTMASGMHGVPGLSPATSALNILNSITVPGERLAAGFCCCSPSPILTCVPCGTLTIRPLLWRVLARPLVTNLLRWPHSIRETSTTARGTHTAISSRSTLLMSACIASCRACTSPIIFAMLAARRKRHWIAGGVRRSSLKVGWSSV
ncbi:hypothetical protein LTR81_025134 [Elasticomyces elasticus]